MNYSNFDEAIYEGIWYESGQSKTYSRGKLFLLKNEIYLELENSISSDTNHAPDLIYGDSSVKFTLVDPIIYSRGERFRYKVNIVIEGNHVEKETLYNRILFCIPELVKWFRPNTIDFRDISKIDIKSKEIPIEIKKGKTINSSFKFTNTYRFKTYDTSTIIPLVQYEIISQHGLTYKDIYKQILELLEIMSLFLLKEITISRIWLTEDIRLHIDSFTNRDVIKKQVDVPLLEFSWIKNDFAKMFINFFEQREKLEPVTSLLFMELSRLDKGFNENNFLNIVRAIEVFHRRFIKKRMNSLIDRLVHLRESTRISFFEEHIMDYDLFLEQLKDSRNYYTHYDKLKKHTAFGPELYRLYYLSKYMAIAYVLEYLGCNNLDKWLKAKSGNFFYHYN